MDDPRPERKPKPYPRLRAKLQHLKLGSRVPPTIFVTTFLMLAGSGALVLYQGFFLSSSPTAQTSHNSTTGGSSSDPSSAVVKVPDGYSRLELNDSTGVPADAADKGWICFEPKYPTLNGPTCFVPNGAKMSVGEPKAIPTPAAANAAALAPAAEDKQPYWFLLLTGFAALITAVAGLIGVVLQNRSKKPPEGGAPAAS